MSIKNCRLKGELGSQVNHEAYRLMSENDGRNVTYYSDDLQLPTTGSNINSLNVSDSNTNIKMVLEKKGNF